MFNLYAERKEIAHFDNIVEKTTKNWPERAVELLMREWRLTPDERKDAFAAALIAKLCMMNETKGIKSKGHDA